MRFVRRIAEASPIFSVPGVSFMGALSDAEGNVLHLIPGQGFRYYERPEYQILTNFSPFKQDREQHPWMGWDRFQIAEQLLQTASEDFGVDDFFSVLQAVAQTVCPTVVSMVFDVAARTVHWCENRVWNERQSLCLRP